MRIIKLQQSAFSEQPAECFGAVWEVELERGEATQPHQHARLEEIYCCLEGEGQIYVAERAHALRRGHAFLVPRSTDHWLENPGSSLLRCLAVESLSPKPEESSAGAPLVGNLPEGLQLLEQQIGAMPKQLNEAEAIQKIVQLFDTAGHLSERIESALGLDNDDGFSALKRVEKRIMDAVVEITRRYQRGLDLGGFGGRLRNL